MRRLVFVLIALSLIAPAALLAQNKAALTIQCNVSGAQVFVNGRLMGTTSPNISLLLPAGTYQVKVAKAGVGEFNAQVVLPSSGTVVQAILGQAPQPIQPQPIQPQPIQPQPIQPKPIQPQPIQPQPIQPQPIQPQPIQPQPIQPQPIQPQPIQPQPIQPQPIQVQPTQPQPAPAPAPSGPQYSFSRVFGGTGDLLRGATRGPDKFVVVGNSAKVLYSSDGRTWIQAPSPSGASNFTSVRWAGDRFVATGDGGSLYTSADGIAWTGRVTGSSRHLSSALWTGERFLVAGQGGTLLGSPDGVNFAPIPTNQSANLLNLAQGPAGIVATGEGGLILHSSDGLLWQKVESGVQDKLYGLAYGRPGFVAGGSSQNCPLLFSRDGRSWTVVYRSSTPQTLGAIHWDGDRYLAGGGNGLLLESQDGQTWRELPRLSTDKSFSAFASGGGTTIAVEANGGILASASPSPTPPPTKASVAVPPVATPPIATPPVATPPAGQVPVTIYWHMPDAADLYLNGIPLRQYNPDFMTRPDEAPLPAFTAKAALKSGDLFTVGTRRGGSWGFMLIAVDSAGRIVWKTDEANWKSYTPTSGGIWYQPDNAGNAMKRPVQVQSEPWYPQKELNAKFGNAAQSIGDPAQQYLYLYSIVQLPTGGTATPAPQAPSRPSGSSPSGAAGALGPNVAQGKSARQSSTNTIGAEADKAVDGNTDGLWSNDSVTHTKSEKNAWWEVDLGSVYRIRKVVVYNRTDRGDSYQRLDNFRVLVGEAPFPDGPANPNAPDVVSQVKAKAEDANEFLFDARGRYIRVQLEGTNYLHIAEVQVFPDAGEAASPSHAAPVATAPTPVPPPRAAPSAAPAAVQALPRSPSTYDFAPVKGTSFSDGFVAYGEGIFVGGTVGKIYFSDPTAQVWTAAEHPKAANGNRTAIWVNDSFYVPAFQRTMMSSADGRTWAAASAPLSGPSRYNGIVWTGSAFVIASDNGLIFSSPDGVNWSRIETGVKNSFNAIAYGLDMIVLGAFGGEIYSSRDGGRTLSACPVVVKETIESLAYGSPGFVAGSSGEKGASILFSPDGAAWSAVLRVDGDQALKAAIWDGDRFLVGGKAGVAYESYDGRAWRRVETGTDGLIAGLATNGQVTVMSTSKGVLTSPTPASHPEMAAKKAAQTAAAQPAPAPAGPQATPPGQAKDKQGPQASAQAQAQAAAPSAVAQAAASAAPAGIPVKLSADYLLNNVWVSYEPRNLSLQRFVFKKNGEMDQTSYQHGKDPQFFRTKYWTIKDQVCDIDRMKYVFSPATGMFDLENNPGTTLERRELAQLVGEWTRDGAPALKFDASGRISRRTAAGGWDEAAYELLGPIVLVGKSFAYYLREDGRLFENQWGGAAFDRVGGFVPIVGQAPRARSSYAAVYEQVNSGGSPKAIYTLGADGSASVAQGDDPIQRGSWAESPDGKSFKILLASRSVRFAYKSEGYFIREGGQGEGIKRGAEGESSDPAKAAVVGSWSDVMANGNGMPGGYSYTFTERGDFTASEGGRGGGGGGKGTWSLAGSVLTLNFTQEVAMSTNADGTVSAEYSEGYSHILKKR